MSFLSYAKKCEGHISITGPYGEVVELKTATCGHCGKILMVPIGGDSLGKMSEQSYIDAFLEPRKDEAHVCHQCWSIVCDHCHAAGFCKPLVKQLDEIEARDRALRSYGV